MKNPPLRQSDTDCEKGIISSAFHSPDKVLDRCRRHGLLPEHFSLPATRTLYACFLELQAEEKPIELLSACEKLEREGKLEAMGGHGALSELFAFQSSATSIDYYIDTFKVKAAIRMATAENPKILEELRSVSNAEGVIIALGGAYKAAMDFCCHPPSESDNKRLLDEYLSQLEDAAMGVAKNPMIPTPLKTLNRRSGGTMAGEVTGIIGLPSSGKSLLGKQFIQNFCFNHEMPSAVFTGEMPYGQWMNRLFCDMGNINFRNLREAKLEGHESKSIINLTQKVIEAPLHVYDQKRIRFTDIAIESEIRKLAKTKGLKTVLIDYLQLISYTGSKKLRTDEEIALVSAMLKKLAIEFGLHMIVLCASSEEGGVRNSRGPEYDFDNYLNLVVRKDMKGDQVKITTEKIIVGKWRDGERGYPIPVEMEGKHCRFNDVAP